MVTTLVHELARAAPGYGLASMCIGVGQGISAIFERP
jgi:3-oxo-5,6-didehydrosuberyl-CoA/3-oxoadipyl-CoA thiolase